MTNPVLGHRLLFVAVGKGRGVGFFLGRNTAELRQANESTHCSAAAGARELAGAQSKSGLCFDFLVIVDCYFLSFVASTVNCVFDRRPQRAG